MSAKKTAKAKAPKATKPAAKPKTAGKTAQAEEAKTVKGECPAGGKHEWHTDDDGERECKKCHEPGDAPKPKGKKPAKAKPASKKTENKPKKVSALDAAAKVLAEAKAPMNTKQMIETMSAKGYWTSPGGKTPQATLYSAILREINTKGKEARFVKTERGQFKFKG
ncbi:MAG: winged helix-turn-helix domain-containing protein [Pirellulales bacterium]